MVKNIIKNLEFLLKPRNMAFIGVALAASSLPNTSFGNVQERVQRGLAALNELDKPRLTDEQTAELYTVADNNLSLAFKEDPCDCGALIGYGKFQAKLGDSGRSIPLLEQAVSECGTDNALEALISAYINVKDFDNAKKNIDVLMSRNKDSFNAHGQLGFIKWAEGDYEGAIAEYEKALITDPKAYWILNNIADTYKKLGAFDSALKYAMQSVKINPNYAEGHFELGVIYRKIGRKQDAVTELRKAVELAPEADNFREELTVSEKLLK